MSILELKTPLVLIGAGGFAQVISEILTHRPDVMVLGCTDKALGISERGPDEKSTLPVLGDDDIIPELAAKYSGLHALLALGPDLMDERARLLRVLDRQKISSLMVVHHRAMVSEAASLSVGTIVRAGAIISADTKTGRHCVLNLACSLDHDVTLGNNVFIGQGARISSFVDIKDNVVIEIGAKINRRVKIGTGARITGGAFVNTNIPDNAVVVGVPGRIVRYEE